MLIDKSLLPPEDLIYWITPQNRECKNAVLVERALHNLVTMNTAPQVAAMLTLALL